MHTLSDLRAGKYRGTRHLVLKENLATFPEEILALADTLEILDLSGNHLRTLPDSFARLVNLRVAFFSFNEFETFPEVLALCLRLEMVGFKSNRISSVPDNALPQPLRWLILTDNRLQSLPSSLGLRIRLQKLMLAGNRLTSLPDLSRCINLELVRISDNALESLPDWLLSLPRLAWLAFSGNPFCSGRPQSAPGISWNELAVEGKIGEGASGLVYRAVWKSSSGERDVAVKIFRNCVTSDGRTSDELTATFAAGSHRSLVPVIGRLEGHPAGAEGLVLALIPDGFRNLAAPPSFDSCTRDVYSNGGRLSARASAKIVDEMTALLDSLHARGICHGDFYAHNMLVNDAGDVLLGDFGAAGFLDDLPRHQAQAMIGIERRALGILETELCPRQRVFATIQP